MIMQPLYYNFNQITLIFLIIGYWESIRINIKNKTRKQLACKGINKNIKARENHMGVSQIQEIYLNYEYIIFMPSIKEKLIS